LPADFAAQLNNLGPDDTLDKALESYRAVKMTQVNGSELRLILMGQCRLPVVIKKIYSAVVSRAAPLNGGIVFWPPQRNLEVDSMAIDLDQPNGAEAREYDSLSGVMGAPYFADKIIDIKEGETHPVEVFGLTKKYMVSWQLGVEAVIGGTTAQITVGMTSGGPIRSTAAAHRYDSVVFLNNGTTRYENGTNQNVVGSIR
jgi:hypothetical protein